jgi:ribulose-5-phosphate 4-epimerase/fuculose-1-phosphate aldolase
MHLIEGGADLRADESERRRKAVEISKRLYNRGFVAGAGGNVSARKPGSNEVLMTPSGLHAHPPVSTGFACARVSLDCPIFPDSIAMVGDIAMVEYITPTTKELADRVAECARDCEALLLSNHGTITLGGSLEQAYQRTEILEDFAKIVLVSKLLGGPKLLSKDEVDRIRALKTEKYRLDLVSVQE